MNKRGLGLLSIVSIIIIISIAVTGAIIFKDKFIKDESNLNEGNETNSAEEVEETDPICSELVLNVEKVECVVNSLGINVTVFRREDSLGIGNLRLNVTGEDGESKMISKLNFSSGSIMMSINNVPASSEIKIKADLELNKDGKKIICPGAETSQKCSSGESDSGNETGNETATSNVSSPSGSVKWIDMSDEWGEYYCDNSTNPEHGIRVYSYQKINNTETLSSNYIESSKVNNICKYYPHVASVIYSIKWDWTAVENVDGYIVYQYYKLQNVTREYDYYIRVKSNTLRDTGLELWNQVS